jgi:prepilin peptidase CpaA
MTYNFDFAAVVLMVTVATLLYAAFADLKHYRISNELNLLLIALFVLHVFLSDRWTQAAWNLALAVGVLLFLIYFYSRRWVGGGDVKMLAVAFLWVGIDCASPFVLLLLLFVSLHTVAAKCEWVKSEQDANDSRRRIPFAPSIAAALVATILLGCMRSSG